MDLENVRQRNIYYITCILKLVSLLFFAFAIYIKVLPNNNADKNMIFPYYSIMSVLVVTFILFFVYCLWSVFAVKIFKFNNIKLIYLVENIIFMGIFTLMIILSNSYQSQYKVLFLFIIITSTLQLGMKHGIITAFVSSAIILVIDLIYVPSNVINFYFENDLILASVFILADLPLAYYVKMEKENLEQKDLQLKKLNYELSKKDNQRKYIEEMLVKNECCYNLLIENSRDSIIIHRDGKLIFVNESAANILGLVSEEQVSGKSIMEFVPFDEREDIAKKFDQIYDKKETMKTFEEKLIKGDGTVMIMQNTSTFFIYDGKPTILSILHDITSEKQVEQLENDVRKNIKLLNETREVNKLITEFLSNISHELKTPLNVIFSAVQLMAIYNNNEEEFIEKRDKYLGVMKQNCYRLMRLINNLLDITKLESGFLKLNAENHNIISAIEEITLSIATYVESKGLELIFDTDVEEKVMAFDPEKIERITLNLLSNAIKFTKPGGKIYVNIHDMKDEITISVKDTGIGIPNDKLDMIFERFGQVNKTFRRNCEGSGIGLYLVKSFVEMHGGSISIVSKLGEGSEFIIKLPVRILEEEPWEKGLLYQSNIESINIEFSDIYSNTTMN